MRKKLFWLLLSGSMLLAAGSKTGLTMDMQGSVIARYLKAFAKENYNEIAFGRVVALGSSKALLYLGKSMGKRQRPVLKEDLVRFAYRPATAGTIFTELAA